MPSQPQVASAKSSSFRAKGTSCRYDTTGYMEPSSSTSSTITSTSEPEAWRLERCAPDVAKRDVFTNFVGRCCRSSHQHLRRDTMRTGISPIRMLELVGALSLSGRN